MSQLQLHQKLDALASLHASIRQGHARLVEGASQHMPDVGSAVEVWDTGDLLSPTGEAAMVTWATDNVLPPAAYLSSSLLNTQQSEDIALGLFGACRAAGIPGWGVPLPGPRFAHWSNLADALSTGWQPSGRLFGCLAYRPRAQGGASAVMHVFDSAAARWLPFMDLSHRARTAGWKLIHGHLSHSPCSTMCAAPAVVHAQQYRPAILVVWVDEPRAQGICAPSDTFLYEYPFAWLPAGHGIVLAQQTKAALAVADLDDCHASCDSVLCPQWVADAAQLPLTVGSSLATLPSGRILLLQVRQAPGVDAHADWTLAFLVYGLDLV